MERTRSQPLGYSQFLDPSQWAPPTASRNGPEDAPTPPMDMSSDEELVDTSCWRGYYSDEGPFDEPCDPIDDLLEVDSE